MPGASQRVPLLHDQLRTLQEPKDPSRLRDRLMDWTNLNVGFGGLLGGMGICLVVARPWMINLCNLVTQIVQPTKMVLIVRSDLMMGKGKVAAQCAHAAIQCYVAGQESHQQLVGRWAMAGQPKVVVKVNSEEEMKSLYNKAKQLGLICCIIKDAGRTQLAPGTYTVLGVGPGPSTDVDQVSGHLKLY